MKKILRKLWKILRYPSCLFHESVLLRSVISYVREYKFFFNVRRLNKCCQNKKMLTGKLAHTLERFLFFPEAYSAEAAKAA
ncbi:MAG: hypothetical protein WC450_10915, partial [Candidatus Omnitrophota bacterium]